MYNCANCDAECNVGDVVFWVENYFNTFELTCCEDCAKAFKQRVIDKLQENLKKIFRL